MFLGSGVIDGTTFLFLSFFCLCFSFVSLRILISFVTRKDSGMRISEKEVLRILGSFIKSSGTILQTRMGRDSSAQSLRLEFSHNFYHFCTATPRSTYFRAGIAAHTLVFLFPLLLYFLKKKLHISWLYFVPPCFFLPTLLTNFHLTHRFFWALFFVFFVFHLQGYEEKRHGCLFFGRFGGIKTSSIIMYIRYFYGSFFRYGGVRRPDQLYY